LRAGRGGGRHRGERERDRAPARNERLAACVQVGGPITSTYRWQGEVETARELLLVAKTTMERLDAVTERVRELHPYDVPEITAMPIAGGLVDYLDWIRAETA
jgi:periplasmic divalent cation tolerance protein